MSNSVRLNFFLDTAFSASQLQHQLQLWKECVEYALYHTVVTEVAAAAQQYAEALPGAADRAVVTTWPVAVWEGVDNSNFTKICDVLSTAAATLSTLVLYVPVELKDEDIEELGQWCRSHYQVNLLDVKIDPSVIGGVGVVGADGRYHEVSLRSRVAENPNLINSLLTTYE